eukprot:1161809-Pelagomonas_calceolata.AAC.12
MVAATLAVCGAASWCGRIAGDASKQVMHESRCSIRAGDALKSNLAPNQVMRESSHAQAHLLLTLFMTCSGPGNSFPPPVYPPQGPTGMDVEANPPQHDTASTSGNMDVEQGEAVSTAAGTAQGLHWECG